MPRRVLVAAGARAACRRCCARVRRRVTRLADSCTAGSTARLRLPTAHRTPRVQPPAAIVFESLLVVWFADALVQHSHRRTPAQAPGGHAAAPPERGVWPMRCADRRSGRTNPRSDSSLSNASENALSRTRPRSSIKIARSRRPTAVDLPQLPSSRAMDSASSALTSDARRQLATDGTATARSRSIRPSRCRNRSSDHSAVTAAFAEPTLPRRDRRSRPARRPCDRRSGS